MDINTHAYDHYQNLTDTSDLGLLRKGAREHNPAAIQKIAQNFEAIIVKIMIQEMRNTVPSSEFIDDHAMKLWESFYDDKTAHQLSQRLKLGLEQQLSPRTTQPIPSTNIALQNDNTPKTMTLSTPEMLRKTFSPTHSTSTQTLRLEEIQKKIAHAYQTEMPTIQEEQSRKAMPWTTNTHSEKISDHLTQFIYRVDQSATRAAEQLGVPKQYLIAHAALESGWGQHEILTETGSSAHNLLGIKATPSWKGPITLTLTTEYTKHTAHKKQEIFRVYPSDDACFRDYVSIIKRKAFHDVDHGDKAQSFIHRITQHHYATDPTYGSKLMDVIYFIEKKINRQ